MKYNPLWSFCTRIVHPLQIFKPLHTVISASSPGVAPTYAAAKRDRPRMVLQRDLAGPAPPGEDMWGGYVPEQPIGLSGSEHSWGRFPSKYSK